MKLLPLLLLAGCAGFYRDVASCNASNFGTDWVVVQMDLTGRPFRCWELHGAAITNEEHSDGIFWEDPKTGNLVHISNLYNRVQVVNGKWDDAFRQMGLAGAEDCSAVHNGERVLP